MARHSQDNLAVRDDFRPLDRGSICIDNGRKNGSTLFILIKRGVLLSGAIHGTLPNKRQNYGEGKKIGGSQRLGVREE